MSHSNSANNEIEIEIKNKKRQKTSQINFTTNSKSSKNQHNVPILNTITIPDSNGISKKNYTNNPHRYNKSKQLLRDLINFFSLCKLYPFKKNIIKLLNLIKDKLLKNVKNNILINQDSKNIKSNTLINQCISELSKTKLYTKQNEHDPNYKISIITYKTNSNILITFSNSFARLSHITMHPDLYIGTNQKFTDTNNIQSKLINNKFTNVFHIQSNIINNKFKNKLSEHSSGIKFYKSKYNVNDINIYQMKDPKSYDDVILLFNVFRIFVFILNTNGNTIDRISNKITTILSLKEDLDIFDTILQNVYNINNSGNDLKKFLNVLYNLNISYEKTNTNVSFYEYLNDTYYIHKDMKKFIERMLYDRVNDVDYYTNHYINIVMKFIKYVPDLKYKNKSIKHKIYKFEILVDYDELNTALNEDYKNCISDMYFLIFHEIDRLFK